MNELKVKAHLLTIPRYDIVSSTMDAILRVIVSVEDVVLPVVFCNEVATSVRTLLLELPPEQEIYLSGALRGNSYTDAVGSQNYLLYLMADNVALTEEELNTKPRKQYQPLKYDRLPFDVADLEDILKFME